MCGKSNREEISGETGGITYPMWHLIILDELDDVAGERDTWDLNCSHCHREPEKMDK